MFYVYCTLLTGIYRKYLRIYYQFTGFSRIFTSMIGVSGKHLVIMGMKKRLLEIFGTSKTYRSPIIIQCG